MGSEAAREPREVRRSGVQEIAKRGVRIGWTKGEEGESERIWEMRNFVSDTDWEAEGSWYGAELRSILHFYAHFTRVSEKLQGGKGHVRRRKLSDRAHGRYPQGAL